MGDDINVIAAKLHLQWLPIPFICTTLISFSQSIYLNKAVCWTRQWVHQFWFYIDSQQWRSTITTVELMSISPVGTETRWIPTDHIAAYGTKSQQGRLRDTVSILYHLHPWKILYRFHWYNATERSLKFFRFCCISIGWIRSRKECDFGK